jgi:hypothetical protein
LTITTWALFRKLIIDSSLQALVSDSGKSLWLLPGSVIATGILCKVVIEQHFSSHRYPNLEYSIAIS